MQYKFSLHISQVKLQSEDAPHTHTCCQDPPAPFCTVTTPLTLKERAMLLKTLDGCGQCAKVSSVDAFFETGEIPLPCLGPSHWVCCDCRFSPSPVYLLLNLNLVCAIYLFSLSFLFFFHLYKAPIDTNRNLHNAISCKPNMCIDSYKY